MKNFLSTWLILSLFYILFMYHVVGSSWDAYWITKDGVQVTGVITGDRINDHGKIDYTYTVGNKDYTGSESRSWADKRTSDFRIGRPIILYHSTSRPWLSDLRPQPFSLVEAVFWFCFCPFMIFVLMLLAHWSNKRSSAKTADKAQANL